MLSIPAFNPSYLNDSYTCPVTPIILGWHYSYCSVKKALIALVASMPSKIGILKSIKINE